VVQAAQLAWRLWKQLLSHDKKSVVLKVTSIIPHDAIIQAVSASGDMPPAGFATPKARYGNAIFDLQPSTSALASAYLLLSSTCAEG
jgi:hypothetical protein